MQDELDISKLKYVLYARKSTDDPQRQVRSIDDQIAECRQLAERAGLKVVKTLKETKSAKKPAVRPVFSQMLRDIKSGKYDAILAWHPDRLARNMKEGGEIIDMVDVKLLQDLKFVTHHFTPDANGKMLLGMSFVLSKQYSDDLSQKVTRGVRRGFLEGKSSGTPKHGYIRTEEGTYQPAGNNFDLVVEAWQMRKAGSPLSDITKFMNDGGYGRRFKKKAAMAAGKVVKMDDRILSKMFKDPFYYGVLVQAKQQVDLRDLYEFAPACSEDDYNAVQELSTRRLTPMNKKRLTFYPLKGIVMCAACGRPMYPAPATGTSKRYLYFRCDNQLCSRQKRSIRAKIIFNWLYDFLAAGLNFTEQEYRDYSQKLVTITDASRVKIQTNIRSRHGAIKAIDREINERGLAIVRYKETDPIWQVNNKRLQELGVQKEGLIQDLDGLKDSLTEPEQDRLSIEQFLNLSKNASAKLKAADEVGKDKIVRWIFLNLIVDEEKVASYSLKEPYATLLNNRQLQSGRGERT